MDWKVVAGVILIAVVVLFNIATTVALVRSTLLEPFQKWAQAVFVWVVPIVGAFFGSGSSLTFQQLRRDFSACVEWTGSGARRRRHVHMEVGYGTAAAAGVLGSDLSCGNPPVFK